PRSSFPQLLVWSGQELSLSLRERASYPCSLGQQISETLVLLIDDDLYQSIGLQAQYSTVLSATGVGGYGCFEGLVSQSRVAAWSSSRVYPILPEELYSSVQYSIVLSTCVGQVRKMKGSETEGLMGLMMMSERCGGG